MKFGLLFVCLLLTTGFVIAQGNATNVTTVSTDNTNISASAVHSAALEARYENVNYGYEKASTAMDTVITYLEGTDTEVITLSGIRNNFTSLFNGLQSYVDANDPTGFGKDVAGMHKVAAQFKRETAQVVAPGEVADLRKLVQNKTEEKIREANMTAIKDRLLEKKARAHSLACALNEERIGAFIERMKEQNLSVDKLQAPLNGLRAQCANITTVNETQLRQKAERIKKNLREIEGNVTVLARDANIRATEKVIAVVNALENKGVNVSGVKKRLETVRELREEVRSVCANITPETKQECREKINGLSKEIGTLSEDIRVVTRDRVPGRVTPERPNTIVRRTR